MGTVIRQTDYGYCNTTNGLWVL